ncbi:signal peptidase I [Actinopolymorpha pittospori]
MTARALAAAWVSVTPRRRSAVVAVSWIAVAWCVVTATVWGTGIRLMPVTSNSMAPTLKQGDHLLVARAGSRTARRGAIVVVRTPASWREPLARLQRTDVGAVPDHLVKRVIGVGGDVVACCRADGQLTVNGVPLDEPYLPRADGPAGGAGSATFEVTVPAGHLWLMGDNRPESLDSRAMRVQGAGTVPAARVRARILLTW